MTEELESADNEPRCEVQKFLDNNQYSLNGILRYEKIFGRTFVSTGGRETTEHFLGQLELDAGCEVLDVGCGIGGSAFIMDLKYGANVCGVDLSKNMLTLARLRREEVGSKNTSFHLQDITKAVYQECQFDLIYSRDTLMHLDDKQTIYNKFFSWLKPGGRIFVTDYSCRKENQTQEFIAYVKERNYKLLSPGEYQDVLVNAGFEDVLVTDLKDDFLDILKQEMKRTIAIRDEYVAEFSSEDYNDIISGWRDKIVRVNEGSQKWISVTGRKPSK